MDFHAVQAGPSTKASNVQLSDLPALFDSSLKFMREKGGKPKLVE